jgi:hypothetical protein
VNRSPAEAVLAEQLEIHVHLVRQSARSASDEDGHEEEAVLVDQPGADRLGGEPGAADGEAPVCGVLQTPNCLGFKGMLELRPAPATAGSVV